MSKPGDMSSKAKRALSRAENLLQQYVGVSQAMPQGKVAVYQGVKTQCGLLTSLCTTDCTFLLSASVSVHEGCSPVLEDKPVNF